MAEAKLTHHELNSALRQAGCGSVNEVQWPSLKNNGAMSVVPRANGGKSNSVA